MKLNKNTIFSLMLLLLFVGSIFAVIAFDDNQGTVDVPIKEPENLDFVNYTASFDANVGEIFPQLIFAGKPIDFDETTINEKLISVPGIKNRQIDFRPDADGNINLVITASIFADKKQEIITKMQNANIFENHEILQFGLLYIPEKIIFTNDQNQEIEYEFIRPNMEGIVGLNTLKGDVLSVTAYTVFRGTELISARALEQINKTAQGQFATDVGVFEIIEYKDKISFDAEFYFEEFYDSNRTQLLINEFSEIESTQEITKPLVLNIADKNQDEMIITLTELKSANKISEFNFEEDNLSIEFDYGNHVSNLLDVLNILEPIEIIEKPKITLFAEVETREIDTEKVAEILNKNLEDIKFSVLVSVDTSEIVISGKNYKYAETTKDVLIDYPEDLNKTEITLNIQGYYQRDNLLYLGLSK